jgi:hypothetical protein
MPIMPMVNIAKHIKITSGYSTIPILIFIFNEGFHK